MNTSSVDFNRRFLSNKVDTKVFIYLNNTAIYREHFQSRHLNFRSSIFNRPEAWWCFIPISIPESFSKSIVFVFSKEFRIWIWKVFEKDFGIETGVKRHHASGLFWKKFPVKEETSVSASRRIATTWIWCRSLFIITYDISFILVHRWSLLSSDIQGSFSDDRSLTDDFWTSKVRFLILGIVCLSIHENHCSSEQTKDGKRRLHV